MTPSRRRSAVLLPARVAMAEPRRRSTAGEMAMVIAGKVCVVRVVTARQARVGCRPRVMAEMRRMPHCGMAERGRMARVRECRMAKAAGVGREAGMAEAAAMKPATESPVEAAAAVEPSAVKASATAARPGQRQPACGHQECSRERGVPDCAERCLVHVFLLVVFGDSLRRLPPYTRMTLRAARFPRNQGNPGNIIAQPEPVRRPVASTPVVGPELFATYNFLLVIPAQAGTQMRRVRSRIRMPSSCLRRTYACRSCSSFTVKLLGPRFRGDDNFF
jgi:hypothetical protein